MEGTKMAALALIAVGVLALIYGGFSFTKETHRATLGSLELSVRDSERVNVPIWVGVGAIVVGGALFFAGRRRI